MMEHIILYSTHCPKCKVLEMKLQQKQIPFLEINDIDIMTQKGFQTAPLLEISENNILEFKEALEWINRWDKD